MSKIANRRRIAYLEAKVRALEAEVQPVRESREVMAAMAAPPPSPVSQFFVWDGNNVKLSSPPPEDWKCWKWLPYGIFK